MRIRKSAGIFGAYYVTTAIAHSLAIGKGCGPTHHFYDLYRHGLPKQESEDIG